MHAAGVKVSGIDGDQLAELAVDANSALHAERCMEVRIDTEDGWHRGVIGSKGSWRSGSGGIVERGIVDDVALLVYAVLVDRLDDVRRAGSGAEGVWDSEAIVEPAVACAEDGLRWRVANVSRSPGEG